MTQMWCCVGCQMDVIVVDQFGFCPLCCWEYELLHEKIEEERTDEQ